MGWLGLLPPRVWRHQSDTILATPLTKKLKLNCALQQQGTSYN